MAEQLLFTRYKCTNCQETIVGVSVQCHEACCQEVCLVLCLQCFASGAELGPHKNSHQYSFNDPNAITIFRGKGAWSALEELKLLKAVEHYGFGNWDDISKDIETRGPEEAKEEYISKFLNGNIGKHTWKMESETRLTLVDHTLGDDMSVDDLQVEKFSESNQEICTPEQALQLGYMPFRDDFEREYDVTAEQIVSNLALISEDDDIESALKLAQVDIYNRRLRERARKKRIARDYKLIQEFFRKFENGKGKSLNQTKDERGLRLSLKNFRQFYTNDSYERLIQSLERERILRIRLTELCRYRWNGLTKIDECEHFERHAAANQHRSTGPFGHGKTEHQREVTSHHQDDKLAVPTTMKYHQQRQMEQAAVPKRENVEKEISSSSIDQKSTLRTDSLKSCGALFNSKNHSSDSLDPMQLGASLLSFNEMQLCSSLNLPPSKYLTIKTVLLSNTKIAEYDPTEKKIRKHFIQAGWIKKSSKD